MDIFCPSSHIPTSFLESTPHSANPNSLKYKKQDNKSTIEREKEEKDNNEKDCKTYRI